MLELTDEQIQRYSRHIILPQVGGKGQSRIRRAKVLVVGAGGLGSPVALYLAAAGVGRIGIVDDDVVEISNLQRQIIHSTGEIGVPKVDSAVRAIEALNPDVEAVPMRLRLASENILDVIEGYDIVVEGSDNFPTKFLVNDACVMAGKPLVTAGILRFEGQAMTILPGRSPCYRCVYKEPPPPGAIPRCQEAGVLGAVAGIMGSIQASEALKLILGIGEPLSGRVLFLDALRMKFRDVRVPKNPNCPVCGENPTITQLIDYELHCEVPS
ncbi:MAG: molybdopterin-synthase adenylyltransferase MoeB [bacterium]